MNYITEINRFYDWLETNQVPKSAIALWHSLMHIANKAGWEQSFTVAISTIESKTGFKRSELYEARNVLTQKGRITWRQRGGNLSAEYELIPFSDHIADAKAYTKAYTSADTITTTKPTQKGTINKLKETTLKKTKPLAGEPPEEKVLYWQKIVDTWFVFYKKNYLIEPTFNGAAAKNLQLIIQRLQKLNKQSADKKEWTEEYALRMLNHFFTKAMSDDWLKSNFLLNILYSKFDSIVQKSNGTNNNKQQTGAGVNTASMLSKIASMPG